MGSIYPPSFEGIEKDFYLELDWGQEIRRCLHLSVSKRIIKNNHYNLRQIIVNFKRIWHHLI